MLHTLVWNRVLILHKILLTIRYITQTTTITKYFCIYVHPEDVVAAVRIGAHTAG
jgi:hypothetical protein